jgi:hypothetical protein
VGLARHSWQRSRVAALPLKGGGESLKAPSPLKGEGWEGGDSQRSSINRARCVRIVGNSAGESRVVQSRSVGAGGQEAGDG